MFRTSALASLLASFVFLSCQSAEEPSSQELTLANPASIALTDHPVAVPHDALAPLPEGKVVPLLLTPQGDTIAAQLDDLDGDGSGDELFFVIDLPADSSRTLRLSWVAQSPDYPRRTQIRFGKRTSADTPVQPRQSDTSYANQLPKSAGFGYQPYQTDGPSWENDKVGFRHYLDGRNAKDLFGKRVATMSPRTVGLDANGAVEDNYHVMEAWGRDVMSVGNSVGIGGVAMMIGDSLYRLGVTVDDTLNNVAQTTFNVVTEGPVRSMMHLGYQRWTPDGTSRTYTVEEQPTIWPGMYAYRNTVTLSGLQGDETLLVGMNNLDPTDSLTVLEVGEWVALLTHDRETYNREWLLGLALIVPKQAYLGYTEAPPAGRLAQAYFAKLKAQESRPVSYYAVGAWELSDPAFRDPATFRQYVQHLTQQVATEVDVQLR
ncbi:protein of unknown function [Catalinimonas alkaloidigena]|uniref:DUF4861 domain-containing protein n=1 Tax=Catalinimonas alkaloidigena TaxID=1075417 RepID=A0A1G8XJJ9_9BACT|nr:DUF4861 family protein [Catalinimonas alkaloidigena]SDJ90557.1 protein of unknown function [Catalinimonas alkaloidigena]